MFTTNDPRKYISYLKKLSFLRVYVDNDIISICALKMLSAFLKKEVIKYEVVFINDNVKDIIKDEDYILFTSECRKNNSDKENDKCINKDSKYCDNDLDKRIYFGDQSCYCKTNRLDILHNIFRLLKQTNSLNESTLWAFIVPFTNYKVYPYNRSLDDEDINKEICTECNKLYNNLIIEYKNIDRCDKDGIFIEKDLNLPLLKYSNLFHSLQNDIFFITSNKLIYKKRKDLEESKIKAFLAKKGISLNKSHEKYNNLDHYTKNYIYKHFNMSNQFIRLKGHVYKMSSLDCFLLMSYYILQYKSLKAFLLLDNYKDINYNRVENIYNIIYNIKDAIANASKISNMIIYKLKYKNIRNINFYINFCNIFIEIYRKERYPDLEYITIIDKDEKVIVSGNNYFIEGIKLYDREIFYNMIKDI